MTMADSTPSTDPAGLAGPGAWLKRRGSSEGIRIATKVGMLHRHGGGKLEGWRIAKAAEASLERLGVETIDLYYAHRDDPQTPMEESLEAFDRLVREGKVRTLGASNFTAERLAEALAVSARLGLARYEVLQNEYHLLARAEFEDALFRSFEHGDRRTAPRPSSKPIARSGPAPD